ncbi:MAG: nucleotidyltransferase domain-containing protein [Deltaproteobacteria bacterium]|nr:nucleotidyltransferase domain-containing protein [Deltaproteobacteria bacterium]
MRSFDYKRSVKIFIQGSYANNTNIKTESDVDITVVQKEIATNLFRPGVSSKDYNLEGVYSPINFKDEFQLCLRQKFGTDVIRKNESIKIIGIQTVLGRWRKGRRACPASLT